MSSSQNMEGGFGNDRGGGSTSSARVTSKRAEPELGSALNPGRHEDRIKMIAESKEGRDRSRVSPLMDRRPSERLSASPERRSQSPKRRSSTPKSHCSDVFITATVLKKQTVSTSSSDRPRSHKEGSGHGSNTSSSRHDKKSSEQSSSDADKHRHDCPRQSKKERSDSDRIRETSSSSHTTDSKSDRSRPRFERKQSDRRKSRSKSRERKRKSRSRSVERKRKSRSRSVERKPKSRSRSVDHKRRSRSRSCNRKRKSRSRSADRKKRFVVGRGGGRDRRRSRSRDHGGNRHSRRRSRSRSKDRNSKGRAQTKGRSRSKSSSRSSSYGLPKLSAALPAPVQSAGTKPPVNLEEVLANAAMVEKKILAVGGMTPPREHWMHQGRHEVASLALSQLPSALPLMGGVMTPQLAVQQAMAAMNAKAQQLTGVSLPKYYNPAAVNPMKYAEQMQKRKLLWQKKDVKEVVAPSTNNWESTTFAQDQDGTVAAKFKKLMGIKEEAEAAAAATAAAQGAATSEEQLRKQEELFRTLDQQYEAARISTHSHRGVGLGFPSAAAAAMASAVAHHAGLTIQPK